MRVAVSLTTHGAQWESVLCNCIMEIRNTIIHINLVRKILRDPQGIPILNNVASITDHSHVIFVWGPEGSPSKITIKVLLHKVYGDKK